MKIGILKVSDVYFAREEYRLIQAHCRILSRERPSHEPMIHLTIESDELPDALYPECPPVYVAHFERTRDALYWCGFHPYGLENRAMEKRVPPA